MTSGRWRSRRGPRSTSRREALLLVVVLLTAGCAADRQSPHRTASSDPTSSPLPTGTSRAVPTPTATGTPAATPTASSTPSAPVAPAGDWKAVPDQASVQGTQFLDVDWTGLRFVAVGAVLRSSFAFLDSGDGSIWHQQPDLPADADPAGIAAGSGGVVAVGSIGERSASWSSTDGLSWTPHRDVFPVPDVGDDTIAVTDVVARGYGWLAVGREDPFCQIECGTNPKRAFVWTSANGIRWIRVATQAAFRGVGLEAVARWGDGFVAVGAADGHAAILTSPDGLTWSRVPDAPMFHSRASGKEPPMSATAVASDDHAVVVLGMVSYEPSRVGAWWSVDGRNWSKAPVDKAENGQVFSAAMTPAGFLATGPSGPDSCLGGIWSSVDGRSWRCDATASAFAGFGPYAAAASDDVVVAVGLTAAGVADESPDGLPGAAWLKPLR